MQAEAMSHREHGERREERLPPCPLCPPYPLWLKLYDFSTHSTGSPASRGTAVFQGCRVSRYFLKTPRARDARSAEDSQGQACSPVFFASLRLCVSAPSASCV